MKRKNLFYVMAASLAFTACADEDFATSNAPTLDGSKVAVEDLNLIFNRGGEGVGSRAAWTANEDSSKYSFLWNDAEDKIGLVYVGQGGKVGLTNYEFRLDSLQLDSFVVKSTSTYKDTTGFYALKETNLQTWVNDRYAKGEDEAAYTAEDLGQSKVAKFRTDYDAIMKGHYVTYFPYNTAYQNAGEAIPVTAPKRYNATAAENLDSIGEYTFAYSKPAEVKAGKQATQFNLQPLTSIFRVKIANELETAKQLKSVVLRTKGNDAFIVKATLNDPSAEPSASNITAAADGKSSTIFVDYPTTNLNIENKKAADKDTVDVFFPVLPTTFASDGVEVILIDDQNMACILEAKFKAAGQTLPAGWVGNLNVTLAKGTKFDQSFVTDATELQDAITKAKTAATATTINLLGDIKSENLDMNDGTGWKKGVTINAATGSTLTLKNPRIAMYNPNINADNYNAATDPYATLTINVPLVIEGGTIAGKVIVDDVTMKDSIAVGYALGTYGSENCYYGQLIVKGDATVEKNAKLYSWYAFDKGITIEEGASLTVKEGGLFVNNNFCYNEPSKNYYKSDLYINGTVTVDEKATFVDKGDTHVGATGKLVINGTAENYNQLNVAGGTVEVAGTLNNNAAVTTTTVAEGYTKAGNIKISTGKLTLAATGKIFNRASLNCMGTFENNGTFNDYVGSVYGGTPFTSDGVYACYVNSQQRLLEAVTRLNIYAAGKYQQIVLQTGTYQLNEIDAAKALTLNIVNEGDVTLNNNSDNNNKPYKVATINSLKVTGKNAVVTIPAKKSINFAGAAVGTTTVNPVTIEKDAKLVISNNLTVKANGAIANEGTFDLKEATTITDIPATVYCTSADVTKGVWTNYPIVTASTNFWE